MFEYIRSGAVSRQRAFLTHLGVSIAVVSAVIAVLYVFWYPGDFFMMAGVAAVLQVLILVDVVLGPSLTLMLFKPGKKGLMFDMSFVLLVQIVALVYGVSVIYKERPYFLVFVVDRYELVSEYEVNLDDLQDRTLAVRPFDDLVYAVAKVPEEPEEYAAYIDSVVFEGKADLDRRPEFWITYEDGASDVQTRAISIDYLRSFEHADQQLIDDAIGKHSTDHPNIGFLPISSKQHDYSMLIDFDSGEPLGIVKVYPWEEMIEPVETPGWLDRLISRL